MLLKNTIVISKTINIYFAYLNCYKKLTLSLKYLVVSLSFKTIYLYCLKSYH